MAKHSLDMTLRLLRFSQAQTKAPLPLLPTTIGSPLATTSGTILLGLALCLLKASQLRSLKSIPQHRQIKSSQKGFIIFDVAAIWTFSPKMGTQNDWP